MKKIYIIRDNNNNTRNNSIIVYVGSSVTVHNRLFSFRAQGVSK